MTDLAGLLRGFLSRYRRAVLTKAILLLGLAAGSLGLLAWRLHVLRWSAAWSVGLPAALACAAVGLGVWWVRRHWIGQGAAAAYLDRTLALQQRLVTAEEVAHAAEAPALYPLLLRDLEERLTGDELRVPRPVDRSTAALAILLLLLLLWPLKGRTPLQQLAALPKTQPPPQIPPETPQPEADSGQQQEQQARAGQETEGAEEAGSKSGQAAGDAGGRAPTRRSGGWGATPPSQPESPGAGGLPQAAGPAAPRSSAEQTHEARAGDQGEQRGEHGTREARGANPSARQGVGQQAAAQRSVGQGGGSTPGQEALKGEIQALLKELQGELKQLQAQLEAQQHAQHEPNPEAGTGSDPELYGSRERSAIARGESLALQLPADTAPVQSARRSSGVGAPSGEVSRQGPQAVPDETAALSEQPLEEQPQARTPVPPEYRDVFRKLSTPPDSKEPTP